MKVVGEGSGDEGEGDKSATVLVGVKFDGRSRELLTWALVKVARSGDDVIALHVLDSISGNAASLLSVVKSFEAMLGVYEGFCNLKQVKLKLKVCRGSSVKKVLAMEAGFCGAATLILGTSKSHHTLLRSSASVAKYCATKLPKNLSVVAVDNGKVVFQRESTCLEGDGLEEAVDNSLALVPFQEHAKNSSSTSSLMVHTPQKKSRWPSLRRVFIPRQETPMKSSCRKISVVWWALRSRGRQQSAAIIYPDGKQNNTHNDENGPATLNGQGGAFVMLGPRISWPCLSSGNDLLNFSEELESLKKRGSSTCKSFRYLELLSATSGFAPENLVGKGGSGYVYRGCFPDGKELAVKILKPSVSVVKEFVLEVDVITSLHHNNVVSLLGFCAENNNLLLVYDFLPGGSLEENLHGSKKDDNTFGWTERYKAAIGIATALNYLHNDQEPPVIHRDVKSSNILLSDDFEPRLSDFGLASWDAKHICTDVAGTFGYLAPEYFMHGRVSEKVDVYAFGVVLLELLSGRKPIDSGLKNYQKSLVLWAKPSLESGKILNLLDPSLESNYDVNQLERIVIAAGLCIRCSPRLRPDISIVLKLLQGDEEVIEWARQQVKNTSGEAIDELDGEWSPSSSNIQSHLNMALLDIDDDDDDNGSQSLSSISDQSVSIEDYLRGRWSRTSSFD